MPPKKTTVADHLVKALDFSGRTQREIAEEIGYQKSNIISMMRAGQTKVPIEKIPPMAKALGVDPVLFVRIALQEYLPTVWETMSTTFGENITEQERRFLEILREADPNGEIAIDTTLKVKIADELLGARLR
ncbi:hypothetical protein HNP73_001588 [Amaricoccus macauensis]|uniref:HTH cro/C1-type domain-containing protein n=1 Tax=Amaricoccus macauensis TaxID=57001 RepID=A0A840SQZ7_9RHOB|nr:helix-turn-helix transcriptional regulator [Amaricoccus macauensis]MBB5221652.1 hypothetical protein [Amaricoccus macauensis]